MKSVRTYYDRYCRLQSDQLRLLAKSPLVVVLLLMELFLANTIAVFVPSVPLGDFSFTVIVLSVLAIYVATKQKLYSVAKPQKGFVLLSAYGMGGIVWNWGVWPITALYPSGILLGIVAVLYWHSFFVVFNLLTRPVRLIRYLLSSVGVLFLLLALFAFLGFVLLTNTLAFTLTNDQLYQRIFWQIGLIGCFVLLVPLYEMPKSANWAISVPLSVTSPRPN